MVGVEKEEGEERVGRQVSRKKRRSWEEVNKITGVKKKFYVRKEKKKKVRRVGFEPKKEKFRRSSGNLEISEPRGGKFKFKVLK